MKIDKIYIACSKKDFYFTKICIASIRYWCGYTIPIELIIDHTWGDINTEKIIKYWNIGIYKNGQKLCFGPFGKIEVLLQDSNTRVLVLDSDIVLLGDLITELEKYDENFIAHRFIKNSSDNEISAWWFQLNELSEIDADFSYPGFVFNSGHFVANSNIFRPSDFADHYDYTDNLISQYRPDVLKCEDQGILNYMVLKRIQENKISFKHLDFMISRYDYEKLIQIRLSDIVDKIDNKNLIHYLGPKHGFISFLPRAEILRFYEAYYYRKNSESLLKLYIDRFIRTAIHVLSFVKELIKIFIR